MGRILSGGVNSSVTGGGTLQNLSTVVVTGEPVVQGQLACIGSDGLAYYALDPAGPGGALRPASGLAPATQIFAAGPAQTLPGASNLPSTGCVLSNGNAVLVGSSGNTLQFGIYSPLGVLQGTTVTLTHASPSINLFAVPLSGGGFVLAYQDQGTLAATVAIYSNSGSQVLAPLIVEAGVSTTSLSITPLQTGGFALAYCNSSGAVRYAVYSATGTPVQAPASAGLTNVLTSSPCSVSISALSGGGFVIAALIVSTASAYFSRFNASGVAQQTSISAFSGGGASNTYGTVAAVGLNLGGFLIVQYSNGASGTTVSTFNATGTTVGGTYSIGSNGSPAAPAFSVSVRSDGGALISTLGTLFIATGAGALGAQASISNTYGGAVMLADGGSLVVLGAMGCEIRDWNNLSLVTTLSYASLGVWAPASIPASLLQVGRSPVKPGVPLLMLLTPGSGSRYVTLAMNGAAVTKATPVGVFGASAAAGSSVPVQYQGVATLASGFVQPFSIDANSSAPPGQRMAIIGNQVVLSGIQSSQNRRQIN